MFVASMAYPVFACYVESGGEKDTCRVLMERQPTGGRDRGPQLRLHCGEIPWSAAGAPTPYYRRERVMHAKLAGRVEILRNVPYFAGLAREPLEELAQRWSERRYRPRATIFLKGNRSDGLYVVLSGRVATFTTSPDGRQQVLHAFGPGRTFGDIAAFDDGLHPGTAQAWLASTVALIPRADMQRVLATHPQAILPALRLFAARLRAFTQIVEDMSLRPVVSRIAGLLIDLAHGNPTLVEDAASLAPRLTQYQIAMMIGSVREVVQRELKVLERAGAIRLTRGEVRVLDVPTLERWRRGSGELESINSGG
jgi:CRP-like cAMP-binding protein